MTQNYDLSVQVSCIGGINFVHGPNILGYHCSERGWRNDFHIGTKGEYQRDEFLVDFDIYRNGCVVPFLADNSLRKMEGLGLDVVETIVADTQHHIDRLVSIRHRDTNNIIEILREINIRLLIGQGNLLETLDSV